MKIYIRNRENSIHKLIQKEYSKAKSRGKNYLKSIKEYKKYKVGDDTLLKV